MIRSIIVAVATAAATAAAGAAQAGEASVAIRDAVARVEVIPEARSDVAVAIQPGRRPLPQIRVTRDGDRVVIDGGLAHRIRGCGSVNFDMHWLFHHSRHDRASADGVTVAGIGHLSRDDMPLITIRTPIDTRLDAAGAVFGRVGATRSLQLGLSGCGDWAVADVQGDFGLAMSGSGDVQAGQAGALRAALSGSGDLKAGRVGPAQVSISGSSDVQLAGTGALESEVHGSGDLKISQVNGPVHSRIAGSGDVTIQGGHASEVKVSVAGSGDFHFGGDAGTVTAAVAGSGDVVISHATGPVSESRAGSGDIRIGR